MPYAPPSVLTLTPREVFTGRHDSDINLQSNTQDNRHTGPTDNFPIPLKTPRELTTSRKEVGGAKRAGTCDHVQEHGAQIHVLAHGLANGRGASK